MTTTENPFATWLTQLRPLWRNQFHVEFDTEPHALLITAQDAFRANITPAQFFAAAVAIVTQALQNQPASITY